MFGRVRKNKGQMLLGEYGLVLILAAAAITAMTVLFSRALQGRIHDARRRMLEPVRDQLPLAYDKDGDLRYDAYGDELHQEEYEPYYTVRASITEQSSSETKRLQSFGSSGIYSKSIDQDKTIQYTVNQLPPKDAR